MYKHYPSNQHLDNLKDIITKHNNLSLIFQTPEETAQVIEEIDGVGKYLAIKIRMRTSQFRKIFDKIKKIESDIKRGKLKDDAQIQKEVILLKPALVYVAARHQRTTAPLIDLLLLSIDKVKNKDDFENLVRLTEALLAYHKLHGGRD